MSTGPLRMREEVARLRGPASAQFYATACAMSSLSAKRGYAAVSVSIPASVTITSTASRSPVGAGGPSRRARRRSYRWFRSQSRSPATRHSGPSPVGEVCHEHSCARQGWREFLRADGPGRQAAPPGGARSAARGRHARGRTNDRVQTRAARSLADADLRIGRLIKVPTKPLLDVLSANPAQGVASQAGAPDGTAVGHRR